jgi:hypothetical protein
VEIRDIPQKGRGLCLTTDIPEGTLLLASKALAINAIISSPDDATRDLINKVIHTIRRNPNRSFELYELYAGHSARPVLEAGVIDPGRIERIVCLNALPTSNEFDLDPAQDHMAPAIGLWMLPSFVNHSCACNAIRVIYGDVQMIRALKDLQAGDEILVNYAHPKVDRWIYLRDAWQIKCNCAWCQEDNSTRKKQKNARIRLLQQKPQAGSADSAAFEAIIRKLEGTYKPSDKFTPFLIEPTVDLLNAYLQEGKLERVMATGQRVLTLLPRMTLGLELQIRLRMAGAQCVSQRIGEAKQTLREMTAWLRNRIGLSAADLWLAAKELLAREDREWRIARFFPLLDEDGTHA